jgi:hypothetical protein
VDLLQSTVGAYREGGPFQTIKLHRLSHVSSIIKSRGHLANYSTQAFEHEHLRAKKAYRGTARRGDWMPHMLRRLVLEEVADAEQSAAQGEREAGLRELKTAYKLVASTGQPHTVNEARTTAEWTAVGQLPCLHPDTAVLLQQCHGLQHLPGALRAYAAQEHLDLDKFKTTLPVVNTALLPAFVSARDERTVVWAMARWERLGAVESLRPMWCWVRTAGVMSSPLATACSA